MYEQLLELLSYPGIVIYFFNNHNNFQRIYYQFLYADEEIEP